MTRRLFASAGARVAVDSARPEALRWLADFLTPSFRAARGGRAPDAVVRFEVGAARLAARLRAARRTGGAAACFTMDRGPARWPLFRPAGGGPAFAYDAAEGVLVEPRPATRGGPGRVLVLAAADDKRARIALMRVVRELATAAARRGGALLLHAAAVAGPGGVTAIVGPKRSGKTSLLLHALGAPGARFVANDRALVDAAPARPSIAGLPTIVRLRPGALRLFPAIGAALEGRAWRFDRLEEEAAEATEANPRLPSVDGSPTTSRTHSRFRANSIAPATDARPAATARGARAPRARRGPPGLRSSQLMALLGAAGLSSGPLARIVFPRVARRGAAPFALERLPAAEAARRLRRDGLLAGGRAAGFLATLPGRATGAELGGALERLAARVPCYACALGPGAFASPALRDALGRAGSRPPARGAGRLLEATA